MKKTLFVQFLFVGLLFPQEIELDNIDPSNIDPALIQNLTPEQLDVLRNNMSQDFTTEMNNDFREERDN